MSPGSLYSQSLTSPDSRSQRAAGSARALPTSRRAPAPVGDDVGRHGRAQAPVALVDVLDDPLAPVAARQVEVDVGPLAALFGQKALEEQLHPHRIDGRDPERVAHGAVGGRAPPLHEDVVAAAVFDQVPDDQEVARQVEAADELDLALDLFSRALAERPRAVARRRACLAEGAEEADRRLARRQRVVGEAIAQVLEREAEPQRQLAAVLATAAGQSAKSRSISRPGLRNLSLLSASSLPA